MPAPERFSILLVDNDPMVARVLNRILHEFTPIRYASSGREALKLAHDSVPDLVLLDVNMPEMNGFEVCKAFKLDAALRQVPIIFNTSHENAELQAKALQIGAADFIGKPPQEAVVLARVRTFQRMKMLSDTLSDTLQSAITMDFLTGTVTRRDIEKSVRHEWRRSLRCAAPLALLLADIDGFTAYNAAFGEHRGDACLKSVAEALRMVAHGPNDVLGRFGGGKFAILLPATDARSASAVAQRAMDAVRALALQQFASPIMGHITVCVGGASIQTPGAENVPEDLITAAEGALKNAKSAGAHCAKIIQVSNIKTRPTPLS